MRRSDLRFVPVIAVLCLVVSACDDAVSPDSLRQLRSSESDAIAEDAADAVVGAIEAGFGLSAPAAVTAGDPVDMTRSHTRECPAGGEVRSTVRMQGDLEQGTGELSVEGSTVFDECARETDRGTLVINGELAQSGTVMVQESGRSANFTITGQITWTLDGEQVRTCTVDLTVTFDSDSRVVTGTVCEREVDRSRDR